MALATAESEHFRRSRRKMTCQDFVNVKLIGRGAFGEVRVVAEKNEDGKASDRIFAMKIMNKDFMIQKNQVRMLSGLSSVPFSRRRSSPTLVLNAMRWSRTTTPES